jgi:hypothetical protein
MLKVEKVSLSDHGGQEELKQVFRHVGGVVGRLLL